MNLIYIKQCKLALILTIHENQDRLNQKSKTNIQNIKRVCVVNLSISHYLIFTNGSKKQTKLGYLSLLDDLPSSS